MPDRGTGSEGDFDDLLDLYAQDSATGEPNERDPGHDDLLRARRPEPLTTRDYGIVDGTGDGVLFRKPGGLRGTWQTPRSMTGTEDAPELLMNEQDHTLTPVTERPVLRISADRTLAVEDGAYGQQVFATREAVEASSAKLARAGLAVRLRTDEGVGVVLPTPTGQSAPVPRDTRLPDPLGTVHGGGLPGLRRHAGRHLPHLAHGLPRPRRRPGRHGTRQRLRRRRGHRHPPPRRRPPSRGGRPRTAGVGGPGLGRRGGAPGRPAHRRPRRPAARPRLRQRPQPRPAGRPAPRRPLGRLPPDRRQRARLGRRRRGLPRPVRRGRREHGQASLEINYAKPRTGAGGAHFGYHFVTVVLASEDGTHQISLENHARVSQRAHRHRRAVHANLRNHDLDDLRAAAARLRQEIEAREDDGTDEHLTELRGYLDLTFALIRAKVAQTETRTAPAGSPEHTEAERKLEAAVRAAANRIGNLEPVIPGKHQWYMRMYAKRPGESAHDTNAQLLTEGPSAEANPLTVVVLRGQQALPVSVTFDKGAQQTPRAPATPSGTWPRWWRGRAVERRQRPAAAGRHGRQRRTARLVGRDLAKVRAEAVAGTFRRELADALAALQAGTPGPHLTADRFTVDPVSARVGRASTGGDPGADTVDVTVDDQRGGPRHVATRGPRGSLRTDGGLRGGSATTAWTRWPSSGPSAARSPSRAPAAATSPAAPSPSYPSARRPPRTGPRARRASPRPPARNALPAAGTPTPGPPTRARSPSVTRWLTPGTSRLPDGTEIPPGGWRRFGHDFVHEATGTLLRGDSGWIGRVANMEFLAPRLAELEPDPCRTGSRPTRRPCTWCQPTVPRPCASAQAGSAAARAPPRRPAADRRALRLRRTALHPRRRHRHRPHRAPRSAPARRGDRRRHGAGGRGRRAVLQPARPPPARWRPAARHGRVGRPGRRPAPHRRPDRPRSADEPAGVVGGRRPGGVRARAGASALPPRRDPDAANPRRLDAPGSLLGAFGSRPPTASLRAVCAPSPPAVGRGHGAVEPYLTGGDELGRRPGCRTGRTAGTRLGRPRVVPRTHPQTGPDGAVPPPCLPAAP